VALLHSIVLRKPGLLAFDRHSDLGLISHAILVGPYFRQRF